LFLSLASLLSPEYTPINRIGHGAVCEPYKPYVP
jgi:hypothetical protein